MEILILIFLCFTITIAYDESCINDLLNSFATPPHSTEYYRWKGFNCDESQTVTFISIANQANNAKLTTATYLNNHFSGVLPSFPNISLFEQVYLDNPKSIFSGLKSLQTLADWSFPNENVDSTSLVAFLATNLQMQGDNPNFCGNIPWLKTFELSNNNWNGTLPGYFQGSANPKILVNLIKVVSGMTQLNQVWIYGNKCNRTIPDLYAFTDIFYLQHSDNHFTGIVPPIVDWSTLLNVTLQNNMLQGTMPEFQTNIDVNVGNYSIKNSTRLKFGIYGPFLSANVYGEGSNGSKVSGGIVAGVETGAIVFIVIVVFVSYKCYMRKKKMQRKEAQEEQGRIFSQVAPDLPMRFTHKSLMTATNNFDVRRKLGVGGFGSVFEGSIRDGTKIAVKRSDNLRQGQKEFLAEVRTIGSIHHVNLVKLVGFCVEDDKRLLVYEFLGKGSLDKWIFGKNSRSSLIWDTKKKIILQIAKGLTYLHEDCQRRIYHLDVKPQNVLLDDSFNAKLFDFGLSKLIDKDQSFAMTQMRGTRGYLAPEWLGRKITEKVDVYSYGVVALEVVFERKNLDYSQPEESTLIHNVKQKVEENKLFDMIQQCCDTMQQNVADVEKIVKVALMCLHVEPTKRPSMSMVVKVLEGAMSLEAISDYTLEILNNSGHPAIVEMTQLSASIISGPR